MKKFLFLGALAAMLLGTASCSNEMEPEMTGEGNVQFTIELPGNVDSRDISDGLTATELQVAVYKVKDDGTRTLLNDISLLGDKKVTMNNKMATVNFKLVKGQKYSFAFWAQKPGCEAYAFDASTGKVTVDYSKALANVDDGDAFSNSENNMVVTGPMTKTIYLYRPFAQLNYGDVMEDYAAATAAGIDFKQTQVTVKQVSTEFDVMGQKASSTALTNVTWPAAASAIGEDLKVVDGDKTVSYKWLSMCYFLVPNDESNVETELSLLNTAGTEFNKLTVNNVPVQKNHRTNILGNLFTEDVIFNIIIDQRFDEPDNNINLMSVAEALEAVKVPGATVNLTPGSVFTMDMSTIAEGVTINGNNSVLKFTNESTEQEHTINSENVTINGLKIENTDTKNDNVSILIINAKNFTIKNCEYTKSSYQDCMKIQGGAADGTILIEGCTMASTDKIWKAIHMFGNSTVKIVDCYIDAVYPFNCNGSNNEVIVENSTLLGWTSYDNGTGHTVTFTNCTFKRGFGGKAYLRPYQNTIINNCKFSSDYRINPVNQCTVTITNSTWLDGGAVDVTLIDWSEGTSGSPNSPTNTDGTTVYIDGVDVHPQP